MRANAVDFKAGSVGVVVVVQSEVVPVRMVMYDAEGASSGAGASLTAADAARIARRGVRRTAARTAEGASAVADSISSAHSNVGICVRGAVTRILEADLQHFLERERIAFVDERHKVAVGALMARRLRKMKAHESGE